VVTKEKYWREIEVYASNSQEWKKVTKPLYIRPRKKHESNIPPTTWKKFIPIKYFWKDSEKTIGSDTKWDDDPSFLQQELHYAVGTHSSKTVNAPSKLTPDPIKSLTIKAFAEFNSSVGWLPESSMDTIRFNYYKKTWTETVQESKLMNTNPDQYFEPWLYGLRLSYVVPTNSSLESFLKEAVKNSKKENLIKELVSECALVYQTRKSTPMGYTAPMPFYVIPLVSVETKPKNPFKTFEAASKYFVGNYNAAKDNRLYDQLAEKAADILSITSEPMLSLARATSRKLKLEKL